MSCVILYPIDGTATGGEQRGGSNEGEPLDLSTNMWSIINKIKY